MNESHDHKSLEEPGNDVPLVSKNSVEPNEECVVNDVNDQNEKKNSIVKKYGKIISLFLIWLFIVAVMTYHPEKEVKMIPVSVPSKGEPKLLNLSELPTANKLIIHLEGYFLKEEFTNETKNYLTAYLESNNGNKNLKNFTNPIHIPISSSENFDTSDFIKKSIVLNLEGDDWEQGRFPRLVIKSNSDKSMPILIKFNYAPIDLQIGVISAACVLVFLYVLIIWEVSEL